MINVSRRTILRWMKQQNFRDLSFGLTHRAPQSTSQQAPERTLVPLNLPEVLKVESYMLDNFCTMLRLFMRLFIQKIRVVARLV